MNSSPVMIGVLVIAVIAIAAIAFGISRKRRSQKLRERFGPEYDRVVKHEGDVRKGEGVLEFREKRREKFDRYPRLIARAFSIAGMMFRAASLTIQKAPSLKLTALSPTRCNPAVIPLAISSSVPATYP